MVGFFVFAKAKRKGMLLMLVSFISAPSFTFFFFLFQSFPSSMVNVLKFQTLYSILFWPKFCFFMHLFHRILSGMATNVDPDQTALGLHCIFHVLETLVYEILGQSPY